MARGKDVTVSKRCVTCRASFQPDRADRQHCSRACRQRAYRHRQRTAVAAHKSVGEQGRKKTPINIGVAPSPPSAVAMRVSKTVRADRGSRPDTSATTTSCAGARLRSRRLQRDNWESVGLFQITRTDGQSYVTHALGDEHAQRILNGQIEFDTAVAAETRASRQLFGLSRGKRW